MTPAESMLTMIVLLRSFGSGGGLPGGGGCGTAASRPFGVNGVIVMKMTSNTSRMSMNGVTLMSPLGDAFFLATLLLMALLLHLFINFLGQKTDFVDAGNAEVFDDLNNIGILRAGIPFYENGFIHTILHQFCHFAREIVDVHAVLIQ